jgi:hypothetical protein
VSSLTDAKAETLHNIDYDRGFYTVDLVPSIAIRIFSLDKIRYLKKSR